MAAPRAVMAAATILPLMTSAAGSRDIVVSAAVGHFKANLPGAAAGVPEALHQMRIANRRLDVALRLFAPIAPAVRTVRPVPSYPAGG